MVMRQRIPLILALLLCGCTVLEGTPEPPPPLTDKPQEIRRNQTQGLQKIGSVSVLVRGAPSDAEAAIKAKAAAASADYYVITLVDETVVPGQWYSQAVMYRK
ncbi:biofilm peroxide resistance protein BsmA [Pluralibacter gergoviae]|uniref:biofilm peroxide resistance protein BsmA n=1 Tax=Pluralibacter gergoviae TaxID=61647 RepID=UPI0004F61054|nr:biofilm peroxide resistance protein BsmA [Pluralibacter gergoviae]AIQ99668.1 biofilm stress and motility protein A [Pluralibacter gergoviae]EKW6617264.1 biofilm peroxide resistance protein BsmA [Pluralibacter gergoviae]OHY67399.1 bioflm peroxide resistance protein BsmA [Pluralibacter gergoviae]